MTTKEYNEATKAMKELTTKEPNLPEDVAWNIFLTLIAGASFDRHFITYIPQQHEN